MAATYDIGTVVFDHWTITRAIGSGSFGNVYEIQRRDFGETYRAALKVITVPQNQAELRTVLDEMSRAQAEAYLYTVVEDVVREFAIMAKLKGTANVVGYEDHQVVRHKEGIGWDILIRMELLTPVLTYAYQHPFSRRDVIRLGIDMCRALELCQKYNVIHRDIKPDNIFVSDNGDFKLGDFGIARTIERTMSGLSQKGTYNYMAPEVYHGDDYGFGVDTYSLGMVLYRLLNKNRVALLPPAPEPITYSDRQSAIDRRMGGETLPKPYYSQGRLAEIVLKACTYDPKDRYSSPAQMREELEAILYEQSEAELIYPDGDELSIRANEYVQKQEKEDILEDSGTIQNETDSTSRKEIVSGSPSGGTADRARRGDLSGTESPFEEETEDEKEKTRKKQEDYEDPTKVKPIGVREWPPESDPKKKKNITVILACIAALIIIGVALCFVYRLRSAERTAQFQTLMEDGDKLCESDPAQAKELFLQAQKICPEETAAYVSYAYALYSNHEYNECVEYIEDELALGKNFEVLFQNQLSEILAAAYFEKEDYTEAAAYFRLSTAGGDITVSAMRDYAVSLGRIGDTQAAYEVIHRMLDAGADSYVTDYAQAEIQYTLQKYAEAEKGFLSVLDNTSDSLLQRRCVKALGELYRDCAKLDQAGRSPIEKPAMKSAAFLPEAIVQYGLNYDSVLWEMLGLACYQAKDEYLSDMQDVSDPKVVKNYLVQSADAFQHVINLGMGQEHLYDDLFNIWYELEDYTSAAELLNDYESAFPLSYRPHALRSMLLITIEGKKSQDDRNYESAYEEYKIAGSMITGSDDATYYQQLEGLIQQLQAGGWL